MATKFYSNGQPLHLQQGPSCSPVTPSSHFFAGNYANGMGGPDYRAMEASSYLPSDHHMLCPRPIGPPEVRSYEEKQPKRRRLRRVCLFAWLFVLNIVVSVVISLIVLSVVTLPATSKAKENQRTICIPCSAKDSKADDARRLVSAAEDASKGYLCCASDDIDDAKMNELILEGVKQSLQERLKGEELYNLLNNPLLPTPINRNAAHVFLKLARRQHIAHKQRTSVEEDVAAEYELLRDWSSEGNAAFIRQGIAFNASSGHFKVEDAGIYVIYSRIVFEDNDKEEEESDELTAEDHKMVFGHAISLYSYNGYRDLLEDEQLSDCAPGGIVCYNSRIFSTLHLTKDATIAVRVRKSNFVSQRSHTSYFGLYKID